MNESVNKPKYKEQPCILIIDDEPNMIDFIRRGLKHEGYTTLSAEDGIKGLLIAQQSPPDLIILDLMLPYMDGFEVCRRLRQFTTVPILMLTARDELQDRVQGLTVGADDYLTKPFQFKEVAARLFAMLRRSNWQTEEKGGLFLHVKNTRLESEARQVWQGERKVELSVREYDLLYYLMNNANRVLTREAILTQVWGYDYTGDNNIIEVYVRYLRQKLGDPDLISTVRGVG